MSTPPPPVLSLASNDVRAGATQAWKEDVCRVAESLPKPMRSSFARFFPTDACAQPIHAAISEYINEVKHCLFHPVSCFQD
jgi:hypothetical protein